MSAPAQKEKLSFALSEEYQAEFCRAALEKILAAATANESGSCRPEVFYWNGSTYEMPKPKPVFQ